MSKKSGRPTRSSNFKFLNYKNTDAVPSDIQLLLEMFADVCHPAEETIYVFVDAKTGASYCECHLTAKSLLKHSTTDVPLDPDEQAEYRANRDIVEDDVAFDQMKTDAKNGRTFSNIVAEFDPSHNPTYPIKIIGGQHRYAAIKEALSKSHVNAHHGLKLYFGLTKEQRLDVQLISNTNIAASTDLYDRLQETAYGPELRDWCHGVGFLDQGKDFSSKRQRSGPMTTRAVRSFILSYDLGRKADPTNFENVDSTPILCRTGKPDPVWESLRREPNLWTDEDLIEAAREFVQLDQAQHSAIQAAYLKDNKVSLVAAEKALNFSIMTAWAYVAGILHQNRPRLDRHYALKNTKSKDPLNAKALAEGRHKSDPENYRGVGTRNDAKERGRCVELFYFQAEKGKGITPSVVDASIKRHYTKIAKLEQLKAENKA